MSALKSHFPDLQPTESLRRLIYLFELSDIGLTTDTQLNYSSCIHTQPFIFDHVSGTGNGSPQRGVLVVGDSSIGDVRFKISETNWTLSQNHSNITLVSQTKPYPDGMKPLLEPLRDAMKRCFPELDITPGTCALAVANWYDTASGHKICGHTDDQPWYASPPVFASVTTFPEGEPEDYRETSRFQVYDPGHGKYIDLYLSDKSVCIMRADIMHRVLPPLSRRQNLKPRVNVTFRNLSSPATDPLGFTLAMANHYRYYGLPIRANIPSDVEIPIKLLDRYRTINPGLVVNRIKDLTREERSLVKSFMRTNIVQLYHELGCELNMVMMSKSNVVLESLILALEIPSMDIVFLLLKGGVFDPLKFIT